MHIELMNPLTGFAYLPRRNHPVRIDTSQLPGDEGRTLERLVEEAGFFNLPTTIGTPPDRPDNLVYTLTVEDQGRRHTVRMAAPFENPALQELIRRLKAHPALGPG